ncbi:hypothetical protein E5676_scaffold544G00280 [Cucumis melo var. makuwa]|uniref:Uncharacterized protein n=1 Tax=Cucumis melo var. makuwa TaxID=1194695 RepID=A0A5D3C6M8_CUCMM|nr:hypothetical protein E5676_scaffold544G00280 [Cucumis melo var. makuwa]
MEEESSKEEEVVKPSKKRKVTMKKKVFREQFAKRTKWDRTPTRKYHDSTISMDKITLIYCIMEEILENVGQIIYEDIITWVKHPRGARPFPHLIEKLCLKACSTLEKLLKIAVKYDIWDDSFWDLFQDSICDPLAFIDYAFKASDDASQTSVVSPSKEVLEKAVDDPLQKGKETTSEVAGKTSNLYCLSKLESPHAERQAKGDDKG